MGLFLWIAFLCVGIFQIYLAWHGVEYHWGTWAAVGVIGASFFFRFILPISIGAYIGAVDVMGWEWWVGLLIAAPGLLFLIPAVLVEMMDSIGSRRR